MLEMALQFRSAEMYLFLTSHVVVLLFSEASVLQMRENVNGSVLIKYILDGRQAYELTLWIKFCVCGQLVLSYVCHPTLARALNVCMRISLACVSIRQL